MQRAPLHVFKEMTRRPAYILVPNRGLRGKLVRRILTGTMGAKADAECRCGDAVGELRGIDRNDRSV